MRRVIFTEGETLVTPKRMDEIWKAGGNEKKVCEKERRAKASLSPE